ncbi:helix-turn-helix transcriptional regulator [Streptomyces sp. JJ66]|uniref:helix-turn-helix domain-containing protein n=1 Tax=Streptomyces sp. JJ66 TaxID=2803843 RepID=UPI0027E3606E|nr:helix-turn-helix transcriptional regulator [Streptomyces sp. JJ66]
MSEEEWAAGQEEARVRTEAYVLGYHLRQIREEQGLTQADVATAVGVSQARVSQIERNEIHQLDPDG